MDNTAPQERVRNTSTDVEKTFGSDTLTLESSETPPRTWRRRKLRARRLPSARNTSTDVEKTINFVTDNLGTMETPPRTWRRL